MKLKVTGWQSKLFGALTIAIFVFVIGGHSKVFAFSASGIPAGLGNALNIYDHGGDPPPNCYSNPTYLNPAYAGWLSEAGSPSNDGTLNVSVGQTSAPLQFNALEYQCQRFISPGGIFWPADIPPGGSITSAAKALTYDRTAVVNLSVISGGGSFSGPPAQLYLGQNVNSRFWYDSASGYSYNPPGGSFTAAMNGTQITVRLTYVGINTFHNNTPICIGSGGTATSSLPPANCGSSYTDATFTLDVATPVLNLQKQTMPGYPADGSTVKPGQSLGFRMVYNNPGAAGANWVDLTDAIPANTTYVSMGGGATTTTYHSTPSPPFLGQPASQYAEWFQNTMPAGATNWYNDLVVKINPDTPEGTKICNFAYLRSISTAPIKSNQICFTVKGASIATICPPFTSPDPTKVPINTPNLKNPTSLPAASASSPSTVNVYTPTSYTLNSVTASTSNDTTTFTPTTSTSGNFTADYTKFFRDYPYDTQTVNANYSETYSSTTYTLSSTPTTSCPAGSTATGFGCGIQDSSGNWTYVSPITIYTYSYTVGSSSAGLTTSGSTTATPIPECFSRDFSLQPQNGNIAFDSNENPMKINYSGSVKATFSVSHKGIINRPYIVNGITTSLDLRIYHQDSLGIYSLHSISPLSPSTTTIGPSTYPTGYTATKYTYSDSYTHIPPLSYGDIACVILHTNPSAGGVDQNGTITSITTGDAQQLNNNWPTSTSTLNTVCSAPLAAEPYFKVFGGDAMAGIGTGTPCTNSSATIYGWSNGDYSGAGSQLAAFAMQSIDQFSSAQNVTSSNASPPSGLTFANTLASGTYGGYFGINPLACATDYYTKGNPSSLTNDFIANDASGSYKLTSGSLGNLVITQGHNYFIYVTGDLKITGNITYSGIDPAGNLANMPHLQIVASGNINITNAVTQLDGTYVSRGTVDDCSDITNPNNWYSDTPIGTKPSASSCGLQLIVNGSIIATKVDLHRTFETLHDAVLNGNGTHSAEVFNYSPVTWLSYPQNSTPQIESVTSLPPVL
jgi:uncharacterized repeat protein (TIGR01451 family)